MPPYVRYEYNLRDVVRLRSDPQFAWAVTWRNSILCIDRVRRAVYQLDNGYWDVYYEEDLMPAWDVSWMYAT